MAIERYDNWIAPWGRSGEDHYRNETNMTPLGIHFIIIDCFVYYCWSFRSFCLVGRFVSFRSFRSGRFVGFACFVSFCSRFRLMFLNLVIARGNYQNQWKMPYISANRHIRNSSLNTVNTPFSNSCLFCTVKKKACLTSRVRLLRLFIWFAFTSQ